MYIIWSMILSVCIVTKTKVLRLQEHSGEQLKCVADSLLTQVLRAEVRGKQKRTKINRE